MDKKLLFVAVAALCGCLVYIVFLSQTNVPEGNIPTAQNLAKTEAATDNVGVHLYFSDMETPFLIAEKKVVQHSENPSIFGRAILVALLKGPNDVRVPTVPKGTTLRALYVTDDGTAYADMSESIRENHPGGIRSELMTIYSIVNSLILNVPEIDAVKILVGGKETDTLAGHIDLRYRFKANMLLIR